MIIFHNIILYLLTYENRMQRERAGEKHEKAKLEKLMYIMKGLKATQAEDSEKIQRLTNMVEQLLLYQRGNDLF